MSLIDRLARWFNRPLQSGPTYGAEYRQAGGVWLPSYAYNKPQWPDHDIPTAIATFGAAATIFACVTYRAQAVATAQLRAYRGEGSQRAPVDDHAVRDLARRPNPQMSEAEFWAAVQLITDVTDFCVIEKERAVAGNVLSLWPLRSDWLKPIPRRNAPPDWEYRAGNRDPRQLDAENVIVVTAGTSPLLPITGFGPMRLATGEGAIIKAMMDYLLGFWQNGALPAYGLVPSEAAMESTAVNLQADADAMREKWDQTVKAGIPPILWSIKEVVKLGFDFDELAFADLHALTDTNVCKAFGVPPILIHSQAGLDRATYSNYAQARTSFYEDTVSPLWARLDGAFTRSLIDAGEYGDDEVELEFDTSRVPALQEDAEQKRRFILDAWKARVIDQATTLAHLDFPEVEGTEGVYYAPSTVDIDLSGTADAEEAEEPDEPRLSADIRPGQSWTHGELLTAVTPPSLPPGVNGKGQHRAILPATAEYRAAVGDANKAAIERLAERWAPRIAEFFAEQGERVAAMAARRAAEPGVTGRWRSHINVRAKATGSPAPVAVLDDVADYATRDVAQIDWDEEERLLREFLAPFFEDTQQAAFAVAGDALGVDLSFTVNNPFVQSVLRHLATRIVGVNETTRADVRRVVGQALDDGVTLDELASRLKGLFTETYRGRSLAIARTESMVAYGHGSVAAYRSSGQVSFCEVADNPAHTEPYGAADGLSCAQRNGIVVPLDRAAFHIEADHPNGSAALIPLLNQPAGVA